MLQHEKAKGVIDLLTYSIKLDNQPPATFELVSPTDSIILMAPSDQEMQEWIHTLRKDMRKLQTEIMRKSVQFQQVRYDAHDSSNTIDCSCFCCRGWVDDDDDDDDDDDVVVVVITVLHTDETNRNRGQQIQQSREGRLCTNEGCFGWHSDNESRMATSISIAQE
jgi:hypothetical protein